MRSVPRRVLLALLPVVLLAACSTRPAAPLPQAAVLRFGTTADYPPFALRTARGELAGADIEAARRIAARLGMQAQFVPTTWTTLLDDLRAGRFDVLVGGITMTAERAAVGRYSAIMMTDGKRALVRCAERDSYATRASLDAAAVRVMINRGPSMPALAQRLFPAATLVVNHEDESLVPFLLDGRADAWVTDGVVVDHMARRHAGQLCAAGSGPYAGTTVQKAWLLRRDFARAADLEAALADELVSGRWLRDLEAVP